MKFICGNCKGVIREGKFSKHYASWVPHAECGYETFYPEHLPGRDKGEPKPEKVRPIEIDLSLDGKEVVNEQVAKQIVEKVIADTGTDPKPSKKPKAAK